MQKLSCVSEIHTLPPRGGPNKALTVRGPLTKLKMYICLL